MFALAFFRTFTLTQAFPLSLPFNFTHCKRFVIFKLQYNYNPHHHVRFEQ
ncbi:hypothetical protein HMPREF3190_01319 [Umbribacter vaginalis]|nr:hypothetical protein HMPREF3190_01319 [Coriobacteriales bacterium DNF00809]